ncbi:uncharacterized protein [Ptychodera flava]|uniref:uncharacterized protein n=1 Tax=Ptychodera flava TaxID=63121 RepID=UPI00396A6720
MAQRNDKPNYNIRSRADSQSDIVLQVRENNDGLSDTYTRRSDENKESRNDDVTLEIGGVDVEISSVNDEKNYSTRWWYVVLILTAALLVTRMCILVMYFVVFGDCLTNVSTTSTCRDFNLIPNRQAFEPFLPLLSIATSILWLIVIQNLEQKKPTYYHIAKTLLKKLYFWKFAFAWMVVVAYHYSVVNKNLGRPGSYVYIFWPMEETSSAILMFVSNFRKGPSEDDSRKFKYVLRMFMAVHMMVAFENFAYSMMSTIYISLKVLTLSSEFAGHSGLYQAINLTLLFVNARYRWSLADFFLMKAFLGRKDCRVLQDVGDSEECEKNNIGIDNYNRLSQM